MTLIVVLAFISGLAFGTAFGFFVRTKGFVAYCQHQKAQAILLRQKCEQDLLRARNGLLLFVEAIEECLKSVDEVDPGDLRNAIIAVQSDLKKIVDRERVAINLLRSSRT